MVNQSPGKPKSSHGFLVTGSSKFSGQNQCGDSVPSTAPAPWPTAASSRGSRCLPLLSSSRARPLAPRRYVEGGENAATW